MPEVVTRHLRISWRTFRESTRATTSSIVGVLPPPIEPTRAPANLSLPAFSLFYDRPSRISLTRWSSDNCTRRCRWSRRALSVYTAITDLFQPDSFFSTFFHRDFPPISGKKVERVISFQDGTKRRRCYFYSSVRSIRNSLAHRVYISVYIPRRVYRDSYRGSR